MIDHMSMNNALQGLVQVCIQDFQKDVLLLQKGSGLKGPCNLNIASINYLERQMRYLLSNLNIICYKFKMQLLTLNSVIVLSPKLEQICQNF